jgi:hypothetical protein
LQSPVVFALQKNRYPRDDVARIAEVALSTTAAILAPIAPSVMVSGLKAYGNSMARALLGLRFACAARAAA